MGTALAMKLWACRAEAVTRAGRPRHTRLATQALVAAGLTLAGDQQRGSTGALARAIGEGVQNAGYGCIRSQNAHEYDGDGGKRNDESNQQRAQVRPTFL